MDKLSLLKQHFGYEVFRPGQERVIDALLAGRDALAVMPTGAGKSVCYQLPALLLPGIALVVSPLISLMQDQVAALGQAGIRAAYLNSSLTPRQYDKALENAMAGMYRVIYVAPERLRTPRFEAFVQSARLSLVAVDEAHCVSQWGQDFRPSYLDIAPFLAGLPARPPVLACTATATDRVQGDILRLLRLISPEQVLTGFDRPNLFFEVRTGARRLERLIALADEFQGESGIVYCATRKAVEEVTDVLRNQGFSATRYHAGLSEAERKANQEDFLYDRAAIMVATNAFGMGIDKSNVRFVAHYHMPKDLESYYQEAGRAGRDGEPARCTLLYSRQDIMTQRRLMERSALESVLPPEELALVQEKANQRLNQMIAYAEGTGCLRQALLTYFGQAPGPPCGNCGNCTTEMERIDFTAMARPILKAVQETGGRLSQVLVTRLLCGSKDQRIFQWGLDRSASFGALASHHRDEVRSFINALVEQGFLHRDDEEYGRLTLTEESAQVLKKRVQVWMTRKAQPEAQPQRRRNGRMIKRPSAIPELTTSGEMKLFDRLRQVRAELARRQQVPAYIVFSDATLRDMSRKHPTDAQAFLQVNGVGAEKLSRYGEAFLEVLRAYGE